MRSRLEPPSLRLTVWVNDPQQKAVVEKVIFQWVVLERQKKWLQLLRFSLLKKPYITGQTLFIDGD